MKLMDDCLQPAAGRVGGRIVWVAALAAAATMLGPVGAAPPDDGIGEAAQPSMKLLPYSFERGSVGYADIVTLEGGARRLGKAMEWGDLVLLFDAVGRVTSFDALTVGEMQFRRSERHERRPTTADLTVGFVERLPREASWHGRVRMEGGLPMLDAEAAKFAGRPAAGSDVTFRVHVMNAGFAASKPGKWRALMDGSAIGGGELSEIAAGGQQVVECRWKWADGPHTLRVELSPAENSGDFLRWNNWYEEATQAVPVAVVVDRALYERFRNHPNMVDSFCFEDWVQMNLRSLNALFANSVHRTSPEGIRERVRCDRILVVDDPGAPRSRDRWGAELRAGGKPDGAAEYGALVVLEDGGDEAWSRYQPLRVNWSMLGQIAEQLGLIDWGVTDTQLDQCLAVDRFERYVQRQHFFHLPDTFMYRRGPFRFSEVCAAFLNKTIGRARGIRGDYLYQVPEQIVVDVRACDGTPLEGARVDVYQLQSEGDLAGYIAGTSPRDPLYSGATGPDGRLELLNLDAPTHETPGGYRLGPNAFGKIATDGSNGLLLLRLQKGSQEEYHFLRLYDCNVAYLRGHVSTWVRPVATRFGVMEAPAAVATIPILMDERNRPAPPMQATWKVPTIAELNAIDEFRVYKRIGLGGDDVQPFALVDTVRQKARRWSLQYEGSYFDPRQVVNDRYSRDTFYSVAPVDRQGRQGNLAPPGCLIHDKYPRKFAIGVDCAFITLGGPGPMQILRWDGEIGTHPFGVRTLAERGYRPDLAGIAVTSDHQLVVTDPTNHVLAFYDMRGDLQRVTPRRLYWPGFASAKPGEFFDPVDVAVDGSGRLYVADRGNNRVQILDAQGQFIGLLDGAFPFDRPHAVAYSNDHVAVTDQAGRRVRLYAVPGGMDSSADFSPRLVREITDLIEADRAVVSRSGKLYVTGFDSMIEQYGVTIWAKDNDARPESTATTAEMGKLYEPRGLYQYPDASTQDYAYFVNIFPFDVRRIVLE